MKAIQTKRIYLRILQKIKGEYLPFRCNQAAPTKNSMIEADISHKERRSHR